MAGWPHMTGSGAAASSPSISTSSLPVPAAIAMVAVGVMVGLPLPITPLLPGIALTGWVVAAHIFDANWEEQALFYLGTGMMGAGILRLLA